MVDTQFSYLENSKAMMLMHGGVILFRGTGADARRYVESDRSRADLEQSGRKDNYGKGKPLSANSVHKVHVVLGAILEAAIDDGHLTVNPTKKKRTVKAPTTSEVRAQKPEIVTWTSEQLTLFLTWNEDELKTNCSLCGDSSPTPA